MRMLISISILCLLIFYFKCDVVGQKLVKQDSTRHRTSPVEKEDSLIASGVKVYRFPQSTLYIMDIKEASKNHIAVEDAMKNLSKEGAVKGKVYGYLQKEGYVEVYVGGSYPNHLLLLTLNGECLNLAPKINGKIISIIGSINVYKSKPAMMIRNLEQIVIH